MLGAMLNIMVPMLALVLWTFVMWVWLYATRLPAMKRAGIDSRRIKSRSELDVLPRSAKQVADNYNHLHEQPTIFYALVTYSQVVGVHDVVNVRLAWLYVALRIVHSLVQATVNFVPARFVIFTAGTLSLMTIALRNLLPLCGF